MVSNLTIAGYLLITSGQRNNTARVTAVAGEIQYVGNGWTPVPEASQAVAKALAVFLNSTPGRLQLMKNAGRTLAWAKYNPGAIKQICIPDIQDEQIVNTLLDCWEATKRMKVPQFGDGECSVRQLWDQVVAEAMGWNPDELEELRLLLHKEPYVRGRRYGHFGG